MSARDDEDPSVPRLRDGTVEAVPRALDEILDRLPVEPGVYLMKDHKGKVIYVGKAARLRQRVRQYFQRGSGDTRDFVPLLAHVVADIETVVTGTEKEALLLENLLIKKHQPRFNVKLSDDKNFLVLRLDPTAEWPRLEVGRRIHNDGAFYFGPYHSATSCREALRVVNRHFQLRTCTDHVLHNRRRPCLQYQIKRCPAPCVLPVPPADYAEQVRDVRLFLDRKNDELLDGLRARMKDASSRTEFERAAEIRDQLQALEATLEAQRVVSTDFVDQDVFGFHRQELALEIAVLSIRQGKLIGSRTFSFRGQEFPDAELLSSFVGLYYDGAVTPPGELLLPFAIEDAVLKAEWLSEKRAGGARVQILVPRRGPRRALIELAQKNAASSFVSRRSPRDDAEVMLARLGRRLRLAKLPRVIECYDISHIQGREPVASMVVFVDGRPAKARYRTFNVRAAGGDDFAAMHEILSRRLRRARAGEAGWEAPDLIVIDGGKGQLAAALAAARDVGVDVRPGTGLPMVALAKERDVDRTRTPDRVFLPQAKDSIPIRPNSGELFVLQALRDEAHRFAVSFHRRQRTRRTLRSELGDVAGIGPERQRALLRHFGSLRKVRDATVEDLVAVPGMTRPAAEAVAVALAATPPEAAPTEGPGGVDEGADDAVESAFADLDEDDS